MNNLGGETKADGFTDGFEVGFNAARDVFEGVGWVRDIESLRSLPAGSLVRDDRERILFKTQANGWITRASTHVSTMYVAVPAEILYHAGYPDRSTTNG